MSTYFDLLQQLQKTTGKLALAVKKGKILYAGAGGGGKVAINRHGEEHIIVESQEPKVVSGYLQDGDQVILEDELGKRPMEEKPKLSLPFHRDFYIRGGGENPHKTKKRLLLITVIVVLAVFSFLVRKNVNDREMVQRDSEEGKIIAYATSKYEEGVALLELNPVRARTILKEGLAQIKDQKSNIKNTKTEEIKVKIEKALETAGRIYKITPEVFMDLSIIKDKANGDSMSLNEGTILVLDKTNGNIYKINLKTKAHEIAGKAKKIENEEDTVSYGNNLYVLNIKDNGIDKYVNGTDKKNYLAAETKVNLEKAVSMTIDGSVWVLFSDGKVAKFTNGREDVFSLLNAEETVSSPAKIYTNEKLINLYILDEASKTVFVFEKKTGQYQARYQYAGMEVVSSLAADESLKKIFLLAGSKIYGIDLK